MKLEYISENDGIRLSEELKLHTTRKLYKSIKSLNLKVYVNGIERKTFEFINKGDVMSIDDDIEKESSWPLQESILDIYYEVVYYIIVNKREG